MLSDADRQLVHDVSINTGYSTARGVLLRTVNINYSVGAQGPFLFQLPLANFTKDAVEQEWAAKIATLRGLGLV